MAVIASTISACSLLTSVGAVLELYKAGGSPGTDPVFPAAPAARPRDRDWSPILQRADTLPQPVSGSQLLPGLPQHQDLALSSPTTTGPKGEREDGVAPGWAAAGAGGKAAGTRRQPQGPGRGAACAREGECCHLRLPRAHLTLRCPCVSRAGGTMKQGGRAALLVALLLLAQLHLGSSQWSPETAAARVRDPSLRWSPGARNQDGGARALLLLLAERFPRRAGPGRWGSRTAGERPRRDDPPLSIDLTFHLLRTLLELARTQSQRERAEQNRIIFESVGK